MQQSVIFPGQGSQSVGMVSPFLIREPDLKPWFDRASAVLDNDLWALSQTGPEATLNQTAWTQPAILTLSVALWHVFKPQADCLAGHSLGEYSALVAAEAMRFEDAVKLVHLRGQLMQAAVPEGEGAMAAIIGLADNLVVSACEETQGIVSAANFNSPGQVVIAGESTAVDAACEQCKSVGARLTKRLAVSIPSHCALMKPAAEKLGDALNRIDIKMPNLPVIHNVDAEVADSPESIKQKLIAQLYSPVQWTRSIEHLIQQGVSCFTECGPGKVLVGLGKRISREATFITIGSES